jgi:hypothetical protein
MEFLIPCRSIQRGSQERVLVRMQPCYHHTNIKICMVFLSQSQRFNVRVFFFGLDRTSTCERTYCILGHEEIAAQHGVHSGWQHSTLHPRHAGLPHRAAGGQFHAIAVRGQQMAMATVHSNSGNIFLNHQGIYLARHT